METMPLLETLFSSPASINYLHAASKKISLFDKTLVHRGGRTAMGATQYTMARNGETIGKKEKEKKKLQKRREKEERRQERLANPVKSTDELVYLDENGNFTSTPPDPSKRREISLDEISHTGIGPVGPTESAQAIQRSGVITYFNTEKAYGFIKDKKTGESIFVHASALASPVRENDRVTFTTERTQKGLSAVDVKKEG